MVVEMLHDSFVKIYKKLIDEGQKPTNIAKQMGYTSTSQLNNVMEGSSMLSTKAIINLIENMKVNPTYLFMGVGSMFYENSELIDEENRALQRDNKKLKTDFEKLWLISMKQTERIKELENLYTELLKNTSKAMEYYSSSKIDEQNKNDTEIE